MKNTLIQSKRNNEGITYRDNSSLKLMQSKIQLAVVGVGRIGALHAQNAAKSSLIDLVAVVDLKKESAEHVQQSLKYEGLKVPEYYATIKELLNANIANVAVVSSPTQFHVSQSLQLLEAGYKVMLEKPLSADIESANTLVKYLGDSDNRLMQAFNRRFDSAYAYVKQMIDDEKIGKVFKIYSVLEDSQSPPDGYSSPGILLDMAIHNADEVAWLIGREPRKVTATGSNLYAHKISSVDEDFDDARMEIDFDDALGIINVSRHHVSGYHVETTVYGTEGRISVGHFSVDPFSVKVVTIGKDYHEIESKEFILKKCSEDLPEFIARFSEAYETELDYFVEQCLEDKPFSVNQHDGLRAMKIVDAGHCYLKNRMN